MALQNLPRSSLPLASKPVIDILRCLAYPLLSHALNHVSSPAFPISATTARDDQRNARGPGTTTDAPLDVIAVGMATRVSEILSEAGPASRESRGETRRVETPPFEKPTYEPVGLTMREVLDARSVDARPPTRSFSAAADSVIKSLIETQQFSGSRRHLKYHQNSQYQQQMYRHYHHQSRQYQQLQALGIPAAAAPRPAAAAVSGIRRFSLPYPRGPGGWSQNKASAFNKASFYDVTVEKYAALPMTATTMQHMMQFGEQVLKDPSYLLRQARFVHRELPIRLAKRLMDLQFLPYIVVTNPHIKQVYDSYRRALDLLVAFPEVRTHEDNEKFTELLALLVEEHTPLIGVLARGVRECSIRPLVGRELNLDSFLDNMLRSRISRRVVAEQHIALQQKRPGYIGVICTNMSAREVVEDAVEEATDMCTRTFGCCPEFVLTGDLNTSFAYIPSHLHYMLFEILKNASRAVVEHHADQSGDSMPSSSAKFPPVIITVCSGSNEVTIKVSDLGGGIPEKLQAKVWRYGYSSVEGDVSTSSTLRSAAGGPVDSQGTPMAGLGFGLPYSRLLAQYLGGNIEMVSIPGYGTDVYVRVRRVVDQTEAVEI